MTKMNYVSPTVIAVLFIGDKNVAQNTGIGFEGDYSGGEILVKDELDEEEEGGGSNLPKAPNLWDDVW